MEPIDKPMVDEINSVIYLAKQEIRKAVVNQEEIVNKIIMAILSGGHLLVEGVPGIAKTLIVRTVAKVSGCEFNRIQFTPDLLPMDLIGITSYSLEKGEYIIKGPIFANFVLADEINRASPKLQTALLECMQEKKATIGKETLRMPSPFFVMATQNPLESLGVYPLSPVQLDRFLFKLFIKYPGEEDERKILKQNMSLQKFEEFGVKPILSPEKIIKMQEATKRVYSSDRIKEYIVEIADATRNPRDYGIKLGQYIETGVSARGSISLFISSKANALLQGKTFVTPQHVKEVAKDCLRHRIMLNYAGQAENIKTDDIIEEILSKVRIP